MSFYYQKKHHHCGDMKKEVKCEIELKEDCKKDKRKGKMVVDFEYARNGRGLAPNRFPTDVAVTGALPLDLDEETQVAAISFKDIQKRSYIELKALFHILTTTAPDAAGTDTAVIRIRKLDGPTFNLSAAEEIFATGPIALSAIEDTVTQLSALDVDDDFRECEEKVTYVLTVEIDTTVADDAAGAYSLVNPITFTGTEYN